MRSNIPNDAQSLISLPPPSDSWLKNARKGAVLTAAKHFLRNAKRLTTETWDVSLQAEYRCSNCNELHLLDGWDFWNRQFLVSTAYYDYAVRRLLTEGDGKSRTSLPPGLNLPAYQRYLAQFNDKLHPHQLLGHSLLSGYLSSLIGSYFFGLFRELSSQNLPLHVFEESAHSSLPQMHRVQSNAPHRDLRLSAQMMVHGLLHLLARIYSAESHYWNRDHHSGPFSAIRLPELGLIARRDGSIAKRYGESRLDKALEHQLALIMQSFGFIVVQTRRGERTVDLVCISGDPREQMTILVEAKSSKRPYTLPVRDQRALVEYVQDVQRNLMTLPPLRLVLIVGGSASSTLGGRLKLLEDGCGVPARFVSAQDLADLRESLPGPLPMSVFLRTLVGSSERVIGNIAVPIRAAQKAVAHAHSSLVRTLLNGSTTPTLAPNEWELSAH